MSKQRITLIVIAVAILLAGVLWLPGFLAQDKCLDSGGRWNADAKVCER